MYGLCSRLFFKSKLLSISSVVFFLCYIFYLMQYKLVGLQGGFSDDLMVQPLRELNKTSWFVVVFFMFIAYEYIVQSKRHFLDETISCTVKGKKTLYINQMAVLESILGALFIISLIFTYVSAGSAETITAEFAAHIFLNNFLNIFVLGNVGVFVGLSTAVVFGSTRLKSYVLLFFFAAACGPIGEAIVEMIYAYTNLNLYKLSYILFILPQGNDHVIDFGFVTSVLPYRFFAAFFWISLSALIMYFSLSANKSGKEKRNLILTGNALLTVLLAVLTLVPQSRVVQSDNVYEFNHGDRFYYDEISESSSSVFPDEEIEDFRVKAYNMKLSVFNQLSAEVTMDVDKNYLDVYGFSLYHGYKVRKVTDQNGKPMEFYQDNDFVVVKNDGRNVEKIVMKYKGYSPSNYSNLQGINLPGDFAYYPHAGFKKIYDNRIESLLVDSDTLFNVSVRYNKPVYSNLTNDGENRFCGKSNGLTLLSGFYKEMKMGGFTFVAPYLNTELTDESYMNDVLARLESLNASVDSDKKFKDKKIIMVPTSDGGIKAVVCQDNIICSSNWYGLPKLIEENLKSGEEW